MSRHQITADPAKEMLFGNEAREALLIGVDKVANAVGCTLGPQGRVVSIYHTFQAPKPTKDGVTVARSITLDDQRHEMGARYVIEAANKTVLECGDGTTTCSVLTQAIYKRALHAVKLGCNPVLLKKEIENYMRDAVEMIAEESTQAENDIDLLVGVAKISSNNDQTVADLVGKAIDAVGPKGTIDLRNSRDHKTYVEVIEGCDIDQGFVHQGFVNTTKGTVEFENPLICLIDDVIHNQEDIHKAMSIAMKEKRPLVVVAHEFSEDVLAVLLMNSRSGKCKSVALQAPGYGDRRAEYLRDIEAIVGASIVGGTSSGKAIRNIEPADLGECEKILLKKNQTIITNGDMDLAAVQERKSRYAHLLEDTTDEMAKGFYNKQLSRLNGKVAAVYVGGVTGPEQKQLKDLVEDALGAVKAAAEEGISPGGGRNFMRIVDIQEKSFPSETQEQAEAKVIMKSALNSIFEKICTNAGFDEVRLLSVNAEIRNHKDPKIGYNAKSNKVENLMEAGIFDATKVQRVALENAVSVAGMMLITECIITYKPEA